MYSNIEQLVYNFYKSTENYNRQDYILFTKYRAVIETKFKKKIQTQIISDIQNSDISISEDNMLFVANNIYVQCCLENYELSNEELTLQMMLRNRAYNNISKTDFEHIHTLSKMNLFIELLDKYRKIIKERTNN